MDAQYPFASRDDIWRVFDELKELHAAQTEQAERLARLERRKDEDARLRSVWGPLTPFPTTIGANVSAGMSFITFLPFSFLLVFPNFRTLICRVLIEPNFSSPADAFKGFDQGQHHGVLNTMGIDTEDEPRRGTSRANSVRFDESANYGYYGQASRSASELPLRTGSGMASLPLTERSLSHRSDGKQSSSGQSHHSARTNSLGLETTSRMMNSLSSDSPLIPPPGLFLLGPVPCIIRCWLTTNFSNDSLLYAAVCSGSCMSSLGYDLVRKLDLEDLVIQDEEYRYIKLPLYLPEASVHQASSRSSSPEPQLPALTVRFIVRDVYPNDQSIQIILGSDVLRSHNADILFSQDRMIMVDDERNKVSIPLVRPENDACFRSLCTVPDTSHTGPLTRSQHDDEQPQTNGHSVGVIGQPTTKELLRQSNSAPASARVSFGELDDDRKPNFEVSQPPGFTDPNTQQGPVKFPAPAESQPSMPGGVWGSWRRDSKPDANSAASANKASRGRTMKVLRPSKPSSRPSTGSNAQGQANTETAETSTTSQPDAGRNFSNPSKPWGSNPVGGASAFGWLNPTQTQQIKQSGSKF